MTEIFKKREKTENGNTCVLCMMKFCLFLSLKYIVKYKFICGFKDGDHKQTKNKHLTLSTNVEAERENLAGRLL